MKEKIYLDKIDSWLENVKDDGLTNPESEFLANTKIQVEQYDYIFKKGLELIKNEPNPNDLLIKILDEYSKRFADLPTLESESLVDSDVDKETKEKIKSLILFGTQAALIKENSRIQNELRKVNQNYQDLFSIITHEFKNSITSIYGYNRMLNKRIDEGKFDTLKDVTSSVDKVSKNLFNLVETLLNMSLIEQKKLVSDRVEYHLMRNVIQPIMDELQLQLDEKSMGIKIVSNEDDIKLIGDSCLLQIALRNLVLNAIQYGYEKTDIEFKIKKEVDQVHIEVYNKGLGLKEEYLPQIFEKFSRFHSKIKNSNVGIGLFTVKHIVGIQNGSIVAESQPDQWMRFLITLPLSY